VELEFTSPRLDAEQAAALMERTHQICPYSKATAGNIEVELRVAPGTAPQAG
jgi:lipoyl-dependent peroxiredoxin